MHTTDRQKRVGATDDELVAVQERAMVARPEDYPVSDASTVRGVAVAFRTRSEQMGSDWGTVWNFRVDRWDAKGQPEESVAVEIRGPKITGSLGEGDWVEIDGPYRPGENLIVDRLKNLTMNAPVFTEPAARINQSKRTWVGAVFLVLFLLMMVIVLIQFARFGAT